MCLHSSSRALCQNGGVLRIFWLRNAIKVGAAAPNHSAISLLIVSHGRSLNAGCSGLGRMWLDLKCKCPGQGCGGQILRLCPLLDRWTSLTGRAPLLQNPPPPPRCETRADLVYDFNMHGSHVKAERRECLNWRLLDCKSCIARKASFHVIGVCCHCRATFWPRSCSWPLSLPCPSASASALWPSICRYAPDLC